MPTSAGMRARGLTVALVLVLALAGAACSSDSKKPSSSGSSSPSEAENLIQQGLDAQGKGQLDVAKQKYEAVLQLDPTNKIAHYDLGVVYQQLNDIADARTEYEKAIAIDAKYTPALFNLAVLETTPNPPRAEDLYRQLLAIKADDANVHFNLGLLLKAEGRTPEGDAELAKAFQLDPSLQSRLPSSVSSSGTSAN